MTNDDGYMRANDGVIKREVHMIDDGILWAINRVLFHPRGYALAYDRTNGEFSLWGNGNEPWKFKLPGDREDEKFRRFEEVLQSVTQKPE